MNHFLLVAGDDTNRLKLAALCQFSLSKTPIIYYGTEIGMTQQLDKDAHGFGGDSKVRYDMPWNEAEWGKDLLTFYQKLIRVRHENPVLRRGHRHRLHLDDETSTYVYANTLHNSDQIHPNDVITIFNLSETTQTITRPKIATLHLLLTTNANVNIHKNSITLPAYTAVLAN